MLIVDSLSHAFGMHRVLNGIYLSVEAGEIVGVVGLNGCGKSTMLRALVGTLIPDAMHLRLDGEPVDRAYRSGVIVYQPQDPYLPRRMRVRRVVGLALPGSAGRHAVAHTERLAPLMGHRVAELSGGEQRYLEVLLATHFPAAVTLLDEPFTEIEPIHRPGLKDRVRAIARDSGRSFIITDHAYRDVLATADRVVVMVDGVLRPASGEADLRRWGYTP